MNPLRIRLFVGLVWFLLIALAHAQPVIISQPAGQTNLPGSSASFTVSVNGAGPFTYQWQYNGTNLPNNNITTLVGNGIAQYAGDGGMATNASLYHPRGVTYDAGGNLYIADFLNGRIRKVDTNNIITTVAGGGTGSDGGAATNASIGSPQGVTFDANANLYISDSSSQVRKVDTNGIISTVAGNGIATYAGDGKAATNASLNNPWGMVFDAYGNLYVADVGNNRIRMIDTNGIITTFAGNGSPSYAGDNGMATDAGLYFPAGVALDAGGDLYLEHFK